MKPSKLLDKYNYIQGKPRDLTFYQPQLELVFSMYFCTWTKNFHQSFSTSKSKHIARRPNRIHTYTYIEHKTFAAVFFKYVIVLYNAHVVVVAVTCIMCLFRTVWHCCQ